MGMDNATVDGISVLTGYWEFAKLALIVIGVVVLLLALPMRRPGKAFAVFLLGLYVTAGWYFLTIYGDLGFEIEIAIAVVILAGLAVLGIFYYFVFIRTK